MASARTPCKGAKIAGARWIVAVDPVEMKRESAKRFGATHTAKDVFEAYSLVNDMTQGQLADSAIITTGVAYGDLLGLGRFRSCARAATVVVTAIAPFAQAQVTCRCSS